MVRIISGILQLFTDQNFINAFHHYSELKKKINYLSRYKKAFDKFYTYLMIKQNKF